MVKRRELIFSAMGLVDWPQWRGPNRDGLVQAGYPSGAWPERLQPRWKVKIGEGHSSPVVFGDRVFTFSRQGERELVSAWTLKNGQKVWQEGYDAPYQMNSAAQAHGKGPKSTPVIGGGNIYALGINGALTCRDVATGKLLWRHDAAKEFKSQSPAFGAAMSPVLHSGLLIAHLGGDGSGALRAFDAKTGGVKWSWKGDGPAYASPIVAMLGGLAQVVTQTQRNIVGVSVTDGKLLWQIPFTTAYEQNSVTPVFYKDLLIFSGLSNPTMATRVSKQGSGWSTAKVWENASVPMYMNSPVISGDLLFGLTHRNKGQFFCLDPASGKVLWTSEGRQGENAALLAKSDWILALTTESELLVLRRSAARFEQVRRYTVADSPTWAHPVLAVEGVLVKDLSSLALWA